MSARAISTAGIVFFAVMAAVEADESLTLRVGESARVEATDLTVSFEEVSSDSRCPKDVNCIQAGEAVIQLAVRTGADERTLLEFAVPPGGGSAAKSFKSFRVTVVELHPERLSTHSIESSDYVATVKISIAE
jgi:hypothetical protein